MERQKTSFNGSPLPFLFVQHFLVFPGADADIAAKQLGEISEIRNTDGTCHFCHTQRSGIEIAEGCLDPLSADVVGQRISDLLPEGCGEIGGVLSKFLCDHRQRQLTGEVLLDVVDDIVRAGPRRCEAVTTRVGTNEL